MPILNKQKAFTLIELMVVVAIIAILTAIVLANLTGAKGKARDAKRISDLAQTQVALELFFDRCNRYPTISNNMPNIADGCTSGGQAVTLGIFISVIPTDPLSTQSYQYVLNGSSDYVLRASFESNNSALQDSYKGSGYSGVTCSGLNYCVIPR